MMLTYIGLVILAAAVLFAGRAVELQLRRIADILERKP
jgi:hypothetical protein